MLIVLCNCIVFRVMSWKISGNFSKIFGKNNCGKIFLKIFCHIFFWFLKKIPRKFPTHNPDVESTFTLTSGLNGLIPVPVVCGSSNSESAEFWSIGSADDPRPQVKFRNGSADRPRLQRTKTNDHRLATRHRRLTLTNPSNDRRLPQSRCANDMHCTRACCTGLQLHGLFLGGIHSARPSQVNFICAKWSFDLRTVPVHGCFPSSGPRTVLVRRKNCGSESAVDRDGCPHNTVQYTESHLMPWPPLRSSHMLCKTKKQPHKKRCICEHPAISCTIVVIGQRLVKDSVKWLQAVCCVRWKNKDVDAIVACQITSSDLWLQWPSRIITCLSVVEGLTWQM